MDIDGLRDISPHHPQLGYPEHGIMKVAAKIFRDNSDNRVQLDNLALVSPVTTFVQLSGLTEHPLQGMGADSGSIGPSDWSSPYL